MSLEVQLNKIDLAIREARLDDARREFQLLRDKKWSRTQIVELCQIAKRLNESYMILRWLHPVIRSEVQLHPPPTSVEKSLFAMALTRIGAFSEAAEILKTLNEDRPEIHYAKANLNVSQWKYAKAIRPLKRYVRSFSPTDYPSLIGQVNLLAAHVLSDQLDEALDLGPPLLERLPADKYPLLRANVLEIMSQLRFRQGEYNLMRPYLNEAAALLKNSNSDYELFVAKWKFILKLFEAKGRGERLGPDCRNLKRLAERRLSFETLREIDFYMALAAGDRELFLKVYTGTRFPDYRSRMRLLYGFNERAPSELSCRIGPPAQGAANEIVDLASLNLTPTSRQMLETLLSDFYRPIQIGEVYKELYPREYFAPQTALMRLYQVFRRLRLELRKRDAPLDIHWTRKQIQWCPTRSFTLQYQAPDALGSAPHAADRIASSFSSEPFSAHDVRKRLGISSASAYNLLKDAMAKKTIKRLRPGVFVRTKPDR